MEGIRPWLDSRYINNIYESLFYALHESTVINLLTVTNVKSSNFKDNGFDIKLYVFLPRYKINSLPELIGGQRNIIFSYCWVSYIKNCPNTCVTQRIYKFQRCINFKSFHCELPR